MCIVNTGSESDVRLFKYNCSLCLRLELCFQPKLFYFEVIKKKKHLICEVDQQVYITGI